MRVELRRTNPLNVDVILCHKKIETKLICYYSDDDELPTDKMRYFIEKIINTILHKLSILTEKDREILEHKTALSKSEEKIKESQEKLKELGAIKKYDDEIEDDEEDTDE